MAQAPEQDSKGQLGDNAAYELKKGILTITVDLNKPDLGASKSGKTKILASSRGNAAVGSVHVGLNVFRKINAGG